MSKRIKSEATQKKDRERAREYYYKNREKILREIRLQKKDKRMKGKRCTEILIDGVPFEVYSIGQAAKQIGRSTMTLRNWEREGVLPEAVRNSGNDRRYYLQEHIDLIKEGLDKYPPKPLIGTSQKFIDFLHNGWEKINEKLQEVIESYKKELSEIRSKSSTGR